MTYHIQKYATWVPTEPEKPSFGRRVFDWAARVIRPTPEPENPTVFGVSTTPRRSFDVLRSFTERPMPERTRTQVEPVQRVERTQRVERMERDERNYRVQPMERVERTHRVHRMERMEPAEDVEPMYPTMTTPFPEPIPMVMVDPSEPRYPVPEPEYVTRYAPYRPQHPEHLTIVPVPFMPAPEPIVEMSARMHGPFEDVYMPGGYPTEDEDVVEGYGVPPTREEPEEESVSPVEATGHVSYSPVSPVEEVEVRPWDRKY